jgi:hypothetical protein
VGWKRIFGKEVISMPRAIINGRWVDIPDSATDQEIRRAGAIKPGRSLIRQLGDGNYVIPPGSWVDVHDGDVFVDAPARIKG